MIGLGYVGLPLAIALVEAGVPVVGVDTSAARIAELIAGRACIEDVGDDRLGQALTHGLTVTPDIVHARDCTSYVICVPTPLDDGLPDLAAVESAARAIGSVISNGDLLVLESTTYPGTTEEVVGPLVESTSGLARGDYLLAYSPERIDPGNPSYGISNTPKVVGGATPDAAKAAAELYGQVTSEVVLTKGTREAEMAKLLENTFRHVNIALVNEMAVFCRELGVDLWDAIDAAATKPFGFMPFTPGPGVGGHCIPVDPSYLSWRVKKLGFSFRFVELAQEVNARMPAYVVSRLTDLLNDAGLAVSRSRILCLGVAYKPGVADCRESPALEVMGLLAGKGATVVYSDPHVPAVGDLTSEPLTEQALAAADAVLVLTAHREFDWDLVGRAKLVLDTRAALPESDTVVRL